MKQVQPEVWVFENVRGVLYSNRWYFEQILEALKALNYVIEVRLVNAVNYGVPQNRERVIVVGHRGEFQFFAEEPNRLTVGEALGEWMFQAPPESKFLTPSMDEYVAKYERASFCIRPRDLYPDQPARTVTCRNLAGATGDMHRIRLPDGRRRRLREDGDANAVHDDRVFLDADGTRVGYEIGSTVRHRGVVVLAPKS